MQGIKPATFWLTVTCSAIELQLIRMQLTNTVSYSRKCLSSGCHMESICKEHQAVKADSKGHWRGTVCGRLGMPATWGAAWQSVSFGKLQQRLPGAISEAGGWQLSSKGFWVSHKMVNAHALNFMSKTSHTFTNWKSLLGKIGKKRILIFCVFLCSHTVLMQTRAGNISMFFPVLLLATAFRNSFWEMCSVKRRSKPCQQTAETSRSGCGSCPES